jgi:hypothetical protein
LLLVFQNGYLKEVATNTHPWGLGITIYICQLKFHIDFSSTEKKQGPKSTYSLVYIQKQSTACFHQSRHSISLDTSLLPLDVNNPLSPKVKSIPINSSVSLSLFKRSHQEYGDNGRAEQRPHYQSGLQKVKQNYAISLPANCLWLYNVDSAYKRYNETMRVHCPPAVYGSAMWTLR